MSRSKDPLRYPNFCLNVAQAMDNDPNAVMTFECKNLKEAHNLKFTFNCFKRAALDIGWADANRSPARFFFPELAAIVVRIVEDPNGTARCKFVNINEEEGGAVTSWNEQALRQLEAMKR